MIPYVSPYVVEASNDHALNGRALGGFDIIVFSFIIDIRGVLWVVTFVHVLSNLSTSVSALTWMGISSCVPWLLRSAWRSHAATESVEEIR